MRLTVARIAKLTCPPGKSEVLYFDDACPGLAVRVRPSGRKTFVVVTRIGHGRSAPLRKLTVGPVDRIPLQAARDRARELVAKAAMGSDPAAEERRRREGRLAVALEAYAADLERRRIVNREKWMRLLRRELLGRFGDVELTTLDRPSLLDAMQRIEAEGFPAKAADFRQRTAVFLNWCVDRGLLPASPLAGWRRPRASRAEKLERPGRALEDHEIPLVWQAFDAATDPIFRAYLRILLLLGQRRTETALMRWDDVDLDAALWTIPAEVTKSGRAHRVPLPPEVVRILEGLPRLAGCDLVFPGRHGRPMTGWSKRMRPVQARSRELGLAPWTLHDLRRTVRTGLARLGVSDAVAERILAHAPRDHLLAVYDRSDRLAEMREALERWTRHVTGLVRAETAEIVALRP